MSFPFQLDFNRRIQNAAAMFLVSLLFLGNAALCHAQSDATRLPSDPAPNNAAQSEAKVLVPAQVVAPTAPDQTEPPAKNGFDLTRYLANEADDLTSRQGTGSAIKIALVLGAISLAPAILLMTTCYIRIIVVLNLLKQAFGGQQLPPNQVITTLGSVSYHFDHDAGMAGN